VVLGFLPCEVRVEHRPIFPKATWCPSCWANRGAFRCVRIAQTSKRINWPPPVPRMEGTWRKQAFSSSSVVGGGHRGRVPNSQPRQPGWLPRRDNTSAGTVLVEGVDPWRTGRDARAALRLRRIGFVFQQSNLMPFLSARDNVSLPAWRLHGDRREALAQADVLLGKVWPRRTVERARGRAVTRRSATGCHRAGTGQSASAHSR
jgi:hypothetical protein